MKLEVKFVCRNRKSRTTTGDFLIESRSGNYKMKANSLDFRK